MEHRLILGGEQYLPFARSRIRALRAAGMQFASQQFVMPDGEVHVRIIGPNEYIVLTGGVYNILSGVVKTGTIIAGEPDVLRSFKPTQQCWQFPLKSDPLKSPNAFNDEPILAIEAHANTGLSGSQYDKLCSSMYSGLMAKAVQVILGLGKQKPTDDGVQVKYDYRWARCHGITKDTSGKSWLIEISQAEGVLAMPLPLITGTSGLSGNVQKVLSETVKLFKGIPSGETFPTGTALAAAITAGTVLRLKTAADMNVVFSKTAFSASLGWSFNDDGTEAHNTCTASVSSVHRGYHYRLDINLGDTKTATLIEVENGPLYGTARFKFYDAVSNSTAFYSTTAWGGGEHTAPIFVCHINGVLDVVRHYIGASFSVITQNSGNLAVGIPGDTPITVGPDDPLRSGALSSFMGPRDPVNFEFYEAKFGTGGTTCLRSGTHPNEVPVNTEYRITSIAKNSSVAFTWLGIDYLYTTNTRKKVEKRNRPSTGMMLRGTRDGYAYRKRSDSQAEVITSAESSWDASPAVPRWRPMALYASGGQWLVIQHAGSFWFDGVTSVGTVSQPPTTYSTTTGPWIDEIDIVTSAGVNSIRQAHASQAASDAEALNWSTTVGICDARISTFGAAKHLVYSAPVPVLTYNVTLSGSMLFSETNPATVNYSFVGYI